MSNEGKHGGVDGFSSLVTHSLLYKEGIHRKATRISFATLLSLVTHSLLYKEGIHRKATRISFATLLLKDLRIHHQRIFVKFRIMKTAHN